jgi:RNA polymerase sigma-70 factor (ECF subfamily)
LLQDQVLIQRISEGDQEAFLYMIETYSKLLWIVIGSILSPIGSPQDIEECVSDVYVHVWRNPNSFDKQRGSLKTFLAIVARSKALDTYRKLSKNITADINEALEVSDDDLYNNIIEKEMYNELYIAIESLSEPNREIVVRRFFFEEKPSDIAKKTSIPIKEVENRLYQSKLKLRKMLSETGGE